MVRRIACPREGGGRMQCNAAVGLFTKPSKIVSIHHFACPDICKEKMCHCQVNSGVVYRSNFELPPCGVMFL